MFYNACQHYTPGGQEGISKWCSLATPHNYVSRQQRSIEWGTLSPDDGYKNEHIYNHVEAVDGIRPPDLPWRHAPNFP